MLELLTKFLRKLTYWEFGVKNAIEMQENSVQFNTFGGRCGKLLSFKCKRGFPEEISSNRREVLIHEFQKKIS